MYIYVHNDGRWRKAKGVDNFFIYFIYYNLFYIYYTLTHLLQYNHD